MTISKTKYKLIKYRDVGMHTYTYFWVNEQNHVVSPYYDSESKAVQWNNIMVGAEHHSDKGYSESTHERQAEFAKKRNYPLVDNNE